jgi:hypothetical protein
MLDVTLCDEICQWLAIGRWFSPGTPVSSTNKTDRHDITEILLKVVLNTITPNPTNNNSCKQRKRLHCDTVIDTGKKDIIDRVGKFGLQQPRQQTLLFNISCCNVSFTVPMGRCAFHDSLHTTFSAERLSHVYTTRFNLRCETRIAHVLRWMVEFCS